MWQIADEHRLLLQAADFVCSSLLGVVLGAVFHFYNLLLKYWRLPRLLVWLGDILIWLLAAFMVFAVFLLVNKGEVRFYHLMGLLLGAGIYVRYHPLQVETFMRKGARGLAFRLSSLSGRVASPWSVLVSRVKGLTGRFWF